MLNQMNHYNLIIGNTVNLLKGKIIEIIRQGEQPFQFSMPKIVTKELRLPES